MGDLQEQIVKKREEVEALKVQKATLTDQLNKQFAFADKMGAVLGEYLMEATKDPALVVVMASDPKLPVFAEEVQNTLRRNNQENMKRRNVEDGRYIVSLVETLANLAKVPQGRDQLKSEDFSKVREELVKFLSVAAVDEAEKAFGVAVKLKVLETLTYVCQDAQARTELQGQPELHAGIKMCLEGDDGDNIKTQSLQLLEAISSEIDRQETLVTIATNVPKDYVKNLAETGEGEVKVAAEAVMNKFAEQGAKLGVSI
uniref:Uncharacterized protein n=1 Tax=Timema poppense TaxID=170557 RepID=A0A7R9HBJ7_TIMPO|nr:unnamed protein product [Timema poppensis]